MKKLRPQQPDPYIKKQADQELAKFGHLNAIIANLPNGIQSIQAGTNVSIDNTDPQNPIISIVCP